MTPARGRLLVRLGVLAVLGLWLEAEGVARAFELSPATGQADEDGPTLTVEREVVVLTVVGASSGWNDTLTWEGAAAGVGFACQDPPPGFATLVGTFEARTELQFSLTTPNGNVWVTGPAERNADGVVHARLTATAPDTVLLEWEDLPDGGDRDFNDCVVALSITPLRR